MPTLDPGAPAGHRGVTGERMVPVLYLDLDGTVRKGKDELGHFVNGSQDVEVFPEAVALMRAWKRRGGRVVAISNQGGVSLGYMTMEDCIESMMATQEQADDLFDKVVFCIHHPQAKTPEMSRCWCRKPRAGMVIEGACDLARKHPGEIYPPHLALFVGDRPEDQACAANADVEFMWAAEWRGSAES